MLILDDGSTDSTLSLLRQPPFWVPDDYTIVSRRDKGKRAGAVAFNNLLTRALRKPYDLIWLMDDDVLPSPNALEKLLDAARRLEGRFSFLASAVYTPGGIPTNPPVIRASLKPDKRSDLYHCVANRLLPIQAATYVSILVNAKVARLVGPPLRDFIWWTDDRMWTFMLQQHLPAYLVADSRVTHLLAGGVFSVLKCQHPKRLRRFYFAIRNSVSILKLGVTLEGPLDILRAVYFLLAVCDPRKPIKRRATRIGVILAGLISGLFFRPRK